MIKHCEYATRSGWNAIGGNTLRRKPLRADLKVKYLVVGAGYAGLAAARRLAELYPDDSVVLVDAGQPGENSSGRNSGFMIDLPYAKIDSRGGPGQAEWQIQLLQAGKAALKEIVDAHGIACGWNDTGHYKGATTQFGVGELRAVEATLSKNNIPFRLLSDAQIRDELGTPHYKRVIWLENCTLVQPAELVNGLAAALPGNVKAYFDTPVTGVAGNGPYRVIAGDREISADHLFLCVNTSLPNFGHARYRQLTMHTYAGLTRELDDAEAAQFGAGADWGMTPVERLEATTRKISGNRFMLRAGFSYRDEMSHEAATKILVRMMLARHPQMPANLFEHVWGGAVSLTRNGDPLLRRVGKQLYAVSGCNASGILKMTALGKLLVDSMAGAASPLLEQTIRYSRPTFIPPDPIRRIAVSMSIGKIKRQIGATT